MNVTIEGTIFRVYTKGDYIDKETGETKKGKDALEVVVAEKRKNGEIKNEIVSLSIPNEIVSKYKGKEGQLVQIKCNYMSENKVTFYGVA